MASAMSVFGGCALVFAGGRFVEAVDGGGGAGARFGFGGMAGGVASFLGLELWTGRGVARVISAELEVAVLAFVFCAAVFWGDAVSRYGGGWRVNFLRGCGWRR